MIYYDTYISRNKTCSYLFNRVHSSDKHIFSNSYVTCNDDYFFFLTRKQISECIAIS